MPRPPHSPWLDLPNDIWGWVRYMKIEWFQCKLCATDWTTDIQAETVILTGRLRVLLWYTNPHSISNICLPEVLEVWLSIRISS
jgi:hypothetical protein